MNAASKVLEQANIGKAKILQKEEGDVMIIDIFFLLQSARPLLSVNFQEIQTSAQQHTAAYVLFILNFLIIFLQNDY